MDVLPAASVQLADLPVQSPVVIDDADAKQTNGEKVEQAGSNLAHVKPVGTQKAKEGEQEPCSRVVDAARGVVACLQNHA